MLLSYLVLVALGAIVQSRAAVARVWQVAFERSERQNAVTLCGGCAGLVLSLVARADIDGYVYRVQPAGAKALLGQYAIWFDGFSVSSIGSDLALILSVVQSLLVGIVFLSLPARCRDRRTIALVAVTFVAMIVVALTDRTLKSGDMYAYVAFIKLGLAAYRPPAREFSGDLHIIYVMWGSPLLPCPYGPLWLGIASLVTSFATDVSSSIFALRAFNVVLMALGSVLIARASGSLGLAAAFALNPALLEEFVIDGHNDLLGIVTLLVATCVARGPLLRAACIVAAGCIKLPLLVVGIIAAVPGATPLRRVLACAAIALSSLGISIAWAGPSYLGSIAHQSEMHQTTSVFAYVTHVACEALLGLGLLRVLRFGRVDAGTAPAAMSMGVLPFSWYFAWGVPMAERAGTLAPFLIAMPFVVGLLSGFTYAWTESRDFAALAFCLLTVVAIVRVRLRGRPARATATS